MREHNRFSWPLVLVGSVATAVVLVVGCSSRAPATGCTMGDAVACTCASGQTGTSLCGNEVCSCDLDEDAGALADPDTGTSVDTPGDATHLDEKPAPTTTYGACAVKGGFGWPCTLTTTGPDPSECTDPSFPDCFAGGQGSWCSASCATFGVCPGEGADAGDAGCVPTACNARGYCK